MNVGKVDAKTISDNLDIEVHHEEWGYTVYALNKHATQKLALRMNFANCVNLKIENTETTKMVGSNVVEANVAPQEWCTAAWLTPINPEEPFSYKYTCATQLRNATVAKAPAAAPATKKAPAPAAAPTPQAPTEEEVVAPKKAAPAAATPAPKPAAPATAPTTKKPSAVPVAGSGCSPNGGKPFPAPEGAEESERKNLCANLDIMINSINNGYRLLIDNLDAESTFQVVLDLSESQNLLLNVEGDAVIEDKKITVTIPPHCCAKCVDMPVDNWDLGSCELRYKAAIKKI